MKRTKLNTIVFGGIVAILPFVCGSSSWEKPPRASTIKTNTTQTASLTLCGVQGTTITLKPGLPSGASALDFTKAIDTSLWLNYSVVKGTKSSITKNIYARITQGSVPKGTKLTVKASAPAMDGAGQLGQSQGDLDLTNTNQTLISAIKTCYTGWGTEKGRRLTYSLSPSNGYANLNGAYDQRLTVCYTIAD